MSESVTNEMETIELARYRGEIAEDLRHMVRKYCRIMAWDVPDVQEDSYRPLIFKALKDALSEVESER